jgi:hypothetical protein
MSDLQAYYENFATQPSRWAAPDHEVCGCRGRGWWNSELDTWHECPFHYVKGQLSPEFDEVPDGFQWDAYNAVRAILAFDKRLPKRAARANEAPIVHPHILPPIVEDDTRWDPDADIPF